MTRVSDAAMSVAHSSWNFASSAWHNPRFQGGLQAFGGLTEMAAGVAITGYSGGTAAFVGGVVFVHGFDNFTTGFRIMFSGEPLETGTSSFLMAAGVSEDLAHTIDFGIGAVSLAAAANIALKSSSMTFPKCVTPKQVVSSRSNSLKPYRSGAENVNSGVALTKKLSQLEAAQQNASQIRILNDGRIRYYGKEILSSKYGPTRGACRVSEYNPLTGKTRSWHECYDQTGKVNRIHPKQLNGQDVISQHYPPIATEVR